MLCSVCLLAASVAVISDSVVYKKPNEIRIPITRTSTAPVIDGRLDDAVWQDASPLTPKLLGSAARISSYAPSVRA